MRGALSRLVTVARRARARGPWSARPAWSPRPGRSSPWRALVLEGRTKRFDERLLLALRVPGDPSRPIGPAWMPEVARDITALGSTDVLALAALAVVRLPRPRPEYAAMGLVVAAVGGGWALGSALKAAFDRPRPDLVPHLMLAYFSSFPSRPLDDVGRRPMVRSGASCRAW